MSFKTKIATVMRRQRSRENVLETTPTEAAVPNESVSPRNSESARATRDAEKVKLSNELLDVLLANILFGYKTLYQRKHYWVLQDQIYQLVDESRILKFFLPAFPVKSSNKEDKVLGIDVDFAESICIDNLLELARKIEAIYPAGVEIIIMSDYHTFDQYIGVDEESYKTYHKGLRKLVRAKGGDDVIQIINLSYFEQFGSVPDRKISATLAQNYGGNSFRASFHEEIKASPNLLNKYVEQKRFFQKDLSHVLRHSTRSKRKKILKDVSKGMISQGVALDKFLSQQNSIKNYIRLSIHQHHPETGKFAIDLFKNKCNVYGTAKLRTPWHNTIVVDGSSGQFYVKFKGGIEVNNKIGNPINILVNFKDKPYFYVTLYLKNPIPVDQLELRVSMIKHSCGMIIEVPKYKEFSLDISLVKLSRHW